MAKDKITDYSATNASNSDVGGIGILGTNTISNFDNAVREVMTHLAEVNAGTYPLADTFTLADPADLTKKVRIDAGNVTAGQTRVLSMPDQNVTITGAAADLLATTPIIDPTPVLRPMFPLGYVQSGHALPYLDQGVQFTGSINIFENTIKDPRYDAGITSHIFASASRTPLGTNIRMLTATINAGGTVASVDSAELAEVEKPIWIQCDDGTIHTGRITAIAGLNLTFTPALGVGKTATSVGSTREVAWGRADLLTVAASGGATSITCMTNMGLYNQASNGVGQKIRIQLDNNQEHLATVDAGTTAGSGVISFTPALPSAAAIGRYVYWGPLDIDPNFTVARKASKAIAGDFGGGIRLAGPTSDTQNNTGATYLQIYSEMVEPDVAVGLEVDIAFATPSGSPGSSGLGDKMFLRKGLRSVNATGGDKGIDTTNFIAHHHNGVKLWANERQAKTGNYTVVNGDNGTVISISGGSYTLTMDAASGYDAGFGIMIRNMDSTNYQTIAINGLATFRLEPRNSVMVLEDNDEWVLEGRRTRRSTSRANTYDLSTASGTVTFTGLGFMPSQVLFRAFISGSANVGAGAASVSGEIISQHSASTFSGNMFHDGAACFVYYVDASNYVTFVFASVTSDGFTLTATKTGSPTGTIVIQHNAR